MAENSAPKAVYEIEIRNYKFVEDTLSKQIVYLFFVVDKIIYMSMVIEKFDKCYRCEHRSSCSL